MSLTALLDKPVTLVYITPGVSGAPYGQPATEETTEDGRCYYQLVSTDDQDAIAREQADFKVYLPVGVVTEHLRAIEIDGFRYEVQGPAFKQWNPRLQRDEFWVLSVRRAVS